MNGWRELGHRLRGELEDLQTELRAISPLFDKVQTVEPDPIEIRAMAATLHAFYNGAERVFLLIAKAVDQKLPESSHWHRELLEQMHAPTNLRLAIIDDQLYQQMIDYLGFRHFFRHSYPMELNWKVMEPLTRNLRVVHERFTTAIESYIERAEAGK